MPESHAPFHKIVGKTYPIVSEIVVRRTHAKEHYAVDGTAYATPRLEERLIIEIHKDGVKVGWAQVSLPPAPVPNAKPPRSADDATIAAEIAELFGV
jgi:hypothetical protein